MGVKSLALIRPKRKAGSRVLPPSSSRGFYGFCLIQQAAGFGGSPEKLYVGWEKHVSSATMRLLSQKGFSGLSP